MVFSIIKIKAGLLPMLKFPVWGFNFRSCAIELSVCSKTSRDTSKDHYLAFPSEKRHCCVEIRNVRYWYFDAS
jgi:hypothetical protein